MASIDAAIAEVDATLDQELWEANVEPEETKLLEASRDAKVSHPSTNTKTTRWVYNLRKGKDGKCGPNYSRCFGDHLMSLVHTTLTHLVMKSGLCKCKRKGNASVTKEFLQLHTRE